MDGHKLVKMANQIAAFFEANPDRDAVLNEVASHIKRFWDPRMRRELVEWLDQHGGTGLNPIVVDAIRTRRNTLVPPSTT